VKIISYQAECGDATRIEFAGSDKKLHHILIDTGFERTYRQVLEQDLKALIKAGDAIDLCIISHIHDDHIGGAIAYIRAIQNGAIGDCIHKWLYNPPRGQPIKEKIISNEISFAKSIAQGDVLATYLLSKGKLMTEDITNDWEEDFFGLKVIVLSPNTKTLKALRVKYPEGRKNPFEREEWVDISFAKANIKDDYHIPINDFNLAIKEEDNSEENGSSIAVLLEQEGKRFLCLADAHPTVIAGALHRLGYSSSYPLVCDWVKVSHHGSKGNNLSVLYNMIKCNNFIISANGENKYKLPSKQCLATIIRSTQRTDDVCNLFFTYNNETLRNIFKTDGEMIFEELKFRVHFSSDPSLIFC